MKIASALTVALATGLAMLPACEEKKPAPATPTPAAAPAPQANVHGHGGTVIGLGEAVIGSFTVKVTRDQGEVTAGKDAAIDATVTPAAGASVKVAAVRFWVGTEDAKGSVKAKADIEDPKDPNRWHTHAEIPNPMPAGAKLWVEVEDDKGGKSVGGFDLKA